MPELRRAIATISTGVLPPNKKAVSHDRAFLDESEIEKGKYGRFHPACGMSKRLQVFRRSCRICGDYVCYQRQ